MKAARAFFFAEQNSPDGGVATCGDIEESCVEEWKPVVGYEGLYEVSSLGRVKSVVKRQGGGIRERKLVRSGKYLGLVLRKDKIATTFRVHTLVAEAFLGPRPAGLDVCHNDSNPLNNAASNLRYDTRKSNLADRELVGTVNRGERQGGAKLTENEVLVIKQLLSDGVAQLAIAKQFGVSRSTILDINTGKNWGWLCSK